jgi:hypothetical protein
MMWTCSSNGLSINMPDTEMESSRAIKTGRPQQIWTGNVTEVIRELHPSIQTQGPINHPSMTFQEISLR